MFRRKQSIGPIGFKLSIGLITVLILWMTWHNAAKLFTSSDKSAALAVVETFYKKEQAGDYGSSWELFHSLMQQRFRKSDYIQMRAHVTMQDFGAKTFTFSLEEPKLLSAGRLVKTYRNSLRCMRSLLFKNFMVHSVTLRLSNRAS